jgi:hypothetical protein
MPLKGRIIGGRERHPDQKTAQAQILRGKMMADVGAAHRAQSRTRQQHGPADCHIFELPGLARVSPKGSISRIATIDERRLKLARSGRTARVGIDGGIKLGLEAMIDHDGNNQQQSKGQQSSRPRWLCSPHGSSLTKRKQARPEHQHRELETGLAHTRSNPETACRWSGLRARSTIRPRQAPRTTPTAPAGTISPAGPRSAP